MVQEYESGMHRDMTDDTFCSGGETIHILSSTKLTSGAKRPRLDISVKWVCQHNVFPSVCMLLYLQCTCNEHV